MRPPSYYNSLANSQPQRYNTNSSLQLRSSLSNPSSTSYATRNHLPFVSQSMLVAHCYTGTTRPYGSRSATGSSASLGSYNNSYSRPRSTKHHSNPYLAGSSSSSSAYSAYSASSASSIASSSVSSSRYLGGASSSLSSSRRPPTSSTSYRSSYTPSASSYYKPIRLRERPLLNQISRHINSASATSRPLQSDQHSESGTRRDEAPKEVQSVSAEKSNEESWQSDVARNISRNKYLIKFREFDRRSSTSPIQLTNNIERTEEEADRQPKPAEHKPQEVRADRIGEHLAEVEQSLSESMKVPIVVPALVERLQEKPPRPRPAPKVTDGTSTCPQKPALLQISSPVNEPNGALETIVSPDRKSSGPSEEVIACPEDPVKSVKKKAPREKKNIKLKIKSMNKNNDQVEDEQRTTTSKVKKAVAPKESPETLTNETSPAIRVKAKRLLKTSKRSDPAEQIKEPKESEKATKAGDHPSTSREPLKQIKQVENAPATNLVNGEQSARVAETKVKSKELMAKNGTPVQKEPVSGSPDASSAGANSNKRIRFREYHIDDFNFLSVLGHGGWGFVILAELKEHDACFAVKCIKKITIVEDDDFESIMIERKVLTLGNVHPFICKLFCTFETDGYLFFVMEYCPGGDLMFHVQKEGKFTESRCRFYAAEIICAMRFLHNQHIIYRDLKLDNILLDSQGHIRLVDFGMCQCRTYREEMLPSNFCGTPEYISPEIIKGVPYNHSVDWWSFGVLLYEMAVGKMPFRGNDENELLWNVCYEQIHYPMFLTKELTTLLQSLLEREPAKRMGMSTCKLGDIHDQAWFRGVDWASVDKMLVKPQFVPEVLSKRDVQNFDADFTESAPELSPVDEATLKRIDQTQFQKFPYTNPNIFIFD